MLALHVVQGPAAAQDRVVQYHRFSEPEGRLLAFYAAALAFSPAGLLPDESRWSLALEVSHIPFLDEDQRRPSIDKPEATNLAPAFPRPRVTTRLGAVVVEASWIPPVRVFDAEANVLSASISGPSVRAGPFAVTPRLWAVAGRVKGTMTCAASAMLGKGADLELYYEAVCHGRESEDWFEPRLAGGEVVASQGSTGGGLTAYALLGARVDRTRFDIGVITDFGTRDPDHPVLVLRAVRPHLALGGSWRVRPRASLGGELFYAPGSLLTARLGARWAMP